MPLTDAQRKLAKEKVLTRRIKELVIAFIKMDSNKEMQFPNKEGIDRARRLVSSMRVKLSRMRGEVRRRGLNLNDFKMILKDISYDPETNTSVITLTKTAPIADAERDVNDVFKNEGLNDVKR